MDKITIKDLEVHYHVGVTEEERSRPQRLLVTVELFRDLHAAATSDALDATTDYAAVAAQLKSFGVDAHWQLIETLAADIAAMLREDFGVPAVTVEVKKFIIPEAQYVSVTLSSPSGRA
jgi:dihydroneopterin aldolase